MAATFAGAAVVRPIYGQPFALVARSDEANVSVLDPLSIGPTAGMVYEVHPFVFFEGGRATRVRVKRIRLFGSGQNVLGTVTLTPDLDSGRAEVYPVSAQSAQAWQGVLVLQEASAMLVCRVLQVRFVLAGMGVVLTDAEVEWVDVD